MPLAVETEASRLPGRSFRLAARVAAAAFLVFLAPGALAGESRRVPEVRSAPSLSPEPTESRSLPGTNRLRLTLSLPLRQTNALASFLRDLYNPASPRFRHYLTPTEFTDLYGPSVADYERLKTFARGHRLVAVHEPPNRMLLGVEGEVTDIEAAFHTRILVHAHPTERRTFFAPEVSPTVPADLPLLDIQGLNNYHLPRPKSLHLAPGGPRPKGGTGPSGNYMGKDFRTAYLPGVSLTGAGQIVGLLEFDGYYAIDIQSYENDAHLSAVPLTNILIDDFSGIPLSRANNTLEVSLDIEMAISMAPGLAAVMVYEAPTNGLNSNDVLNRMATDNLAKQLSSSWDFRAATEGSTDQIFQEFATQGQTFFDASGDVGAYASGIPPPDDNPYITVVGGTTLTTSSSGAWSSETVWNWYTSGAGQAASSGGSSTSYPIPYWQTGISMTANLGSTTKRNIPDVALTADKICVFYNNGKVATGVGGTSCSAPLWAGLTALINQQAVAANGATVGFLNPSLYTLGKSSAYRTAFHDIATGNNYPGTTGTRFPAVSGYDLCTGWGTPAGPALINVLAGAANSLLVTPTNGFTATGAVGGSFVPASQTLTLTNFGTVSVAWSILNSNLWLAVSPSSGTLTPGGAAAVSVTLAAGVETLPAAVYSVAIQVSNVTAGVVVQTLPVTVLAGQNTVGNPGFETGDFTDWTLLGLAQNNHAVGSFSSPAHPELVHSGSYGGLLGEVGSLGYLSQSLPTLPGQLYLLSFWLTSPYFSLDTPNEFQVAWGADTNSLNLLFDQVDLPAFNWTNLHFLVTAPGATTLLQFAARNDPEQFGLDDISVAPVLAPRFTALSAANASFSLTWPTLPGLVYQLQSTSNLLTGTWLNVGAPIAATNTLMSVTNAPAAPAGFYRLLVR